jgi:hypothetical protein
MGRRTLPYALVALAAAVFATLVITLATAPNGARAGNFPPGLFQTRTPTPRTGAATPVPTPPPAAPPPSADAPATGLVVMRLECTSASPTGVRAWFLWTPSLAGGQWLDVSFIGNNFAPGTFAGAGPFPAGTWGHPWDGLAQGLTHFARVNTLTRSGWMASETFPFYTPVCTPHEPYPANDMWALRDRMAAAIANSPIDTAIAVTDLQTGETVDVFGDAPRLPGCTINLFVLMRVVFDLQHGKYPEPQPGDLIAQTINRSDPVTARTLAKYWVGDGDLWTGLRRTNDFVRALGMSSSLYDHPPAYPLDSQFGTYTNVITARDANRGLKAIWDGLVLDPYWRDYLLYKMTLVKPGLNYLIAAGAGAGATVSHKNGFLFEEGWADNDIGIVWFERGGRRYGFAISFFTQSVPRKYDDIPLGQQLVSMAYSWFVSRYGYPP